MKKERISYINESMNMMVIMTDPDIVIKKVHEKISKSFLF